MDDPRMARLYIEAAGVPTLQARRQEAYHVYAQLWAEDVLGIDHPDAATQVAALVFVTGTTQAVISWLEGAVPLTREELIERLAQVGVRLVTD
jgi:hypothetical protein